MGVLPASPSVQHTCDCWPGDQKRELDFLELELHVVSHHVGVGTEPRSSTRQEVSVIHR